MTDLGAYIIQLQPEKPFTSLCLSWGVNFTPDYVTFDRYRSSLFVLSLEGQLKAMHLDETNYCDSDSLKTVIEQGCTSVKYFDEFNSVIYMTSEGLWKLEHERDSPKMVFKVIYLNRSES